MIQFGVVLNTNPPSNDLIAILLNTGLRLMLSLRRVHILKEK
jgi:hypothetical protein